jgi:hypothetical protein
LADAVTRKEKGEGAFARTQKVLGTLVGGLSIFALVARTWEGGIAAPIELLVETYNALLSFFLGWAQTYLHALAETLGRWTGFALHLYPHWKESLVAYGILVGAGLSAWGEVTFPRAPSWLINAVASATGVAVGFVDAILQRDLRPGDAFYDLWQLVGQSYILALTFSLAAMAALVGYMSLRAAHPFLSRRDAEICWTAGKRTLAIYAGAATFALLGAGGKLLGI